MPTIDATIIDIAYDISGNGQKFVRLSDGSLVVGAKNGTTDVRFLKSTDNGQTWSLLATITESNPSLSMVANGTNIYVLLAYSSVARMYKIDGIMGSVSPYTNVDSGQSSVGEGFLAINKDGTALFAAWSSKNLAYSHSYNIRYAKGVINPDGTVSWSSIQQLTTDNTDGTDHRNPSIVINRNGNPVVIYETTANNGTLHLIRSRTYNGSSWGSIVQIYNGNSYLLSSSDSCADKNGRIWLTWKGRNSANNSNDSVYVSYSDDDGANWTAAQLLAQGTAAFSTSSVSITSTYNGNVYILLGVSNNGISQIGKITYSEGSWGSYTAIRDNFNGAIPYPSPLYDLSIKIPDPVFIYKDYNRLGFYGKWTMASISPEEGDLGQKTSGDNLLTFSITSDDPMSTINASINGTNIYTNNNPVNGEQYTLNLSQEQWDEIKYGNEHNLVITMGGSSWTYTFDKRLRLDDDIINAVKGVQDLQEQLNKTKAQLGSVIRSKGGIVNDTDPFSKFISAISGMNNKRWATGTTTSSTSTVAFTYADGSTTYQTYYVRVTGLSFKPSFIYMFNYSSGTIKMTVYSEFPNDYYPKSIKMTIFSPSSSSSYTVYNFKGDVSSASVAPDGFTLPAYVSNVPYTWIAFE